MVSAPAAAERPQSPPPILSNQETAATRYWWGPHRTQPRNQIGTIHDPTHGAHSSSKPMASQGAGQRWTGVIPCHVSAVSPHPPAARWLPSSSPSLENLNLPSEVARACAKFSPLSQEKTTEIECRSPGVSNRKRLLPPLEKSRVRELSGGLEGGQVWEGSWKLPADRCVTWMVAHALSNAALDAALSFAHPFSCSRNPNGMERNAWVLL